jgi:hypothetical protein
MNKIINISFSGASTHPVPVSHAHMQLELDANYWGACLLLLLFHDACQSKRRGSIDVDRSRHRLLMMAAARKGLYFTPRCSLESGRERVAHVWNLTKGGVPVEAGLSRVKSYLFCRNTVTCGDQDQLHAQERKTTETQRMDGPSHL